jgi:NNP family nitrate/nitrite transporter-like MFS transporter
MNESRRAIVALAMSTLAFTTCFACWIVNSVLLTFLGSAGAYSFDEAQVGWLLAAPILTGALSRVPLGILTDRFGGRTVFFALMLLAACPMYLLSYADNYYEFLLASMGFGLAGGSFAVGVGYVSAWFEKNRQGTALGIFGLGNIGAALTTIIAPRMLTYLTAHGAEVEGWRLLPKIYALALVMTAVVFFATTRPRLPSGGVRKTVTAQLAPLRDIIVWRFGLYYFLLFGGFVALAQWIVPYSVNVYGMSVATAGLLAAAFSLPSGVIRMAGGWLSDRFGARTIMYWVFSGSALICLFLSIPRMEIESPGEGVSAASAGAITSVSSQLVVVGTRSYPLTPPPQASASQDQSASILPRITSWHIPVVSPNDRVEKKQLIARGVTRINYPANARMFVILIFALGVLTGLGSAGVYRFIPDQFPGSVGAVGGMVGLLGALGGFIFPPLFGYLLRGTGLWSSCWVALMLLSLVCLFWMHRVVRRLMQAEAPDLVQLLEQRPSTFLSTPISRPGDLPERETVTSVADLLKRVPWFEDLDEEELKKIARAGTRRSVDADEYVFREGDEGDALYVILEGTVKVTRGAGQGNEIELATLRAGDCLGEIALIDGTPRSASVRAVEPCEFFLIHRREFLTLLTRSSRILADILVGLSAKVRQNTDRFYEMRLQKEKLRAQQEIDRHRSLSEMVAGLAHELNTPLGIVNHAASIISEQLAARELDSLGVNKNGQEALNDVREASILVQENIARADRLVRNFKHLSVSQVSDTRETLDLRKLTQEVVGLYKLKARASGLQVEIIDQLDADKVMWEGYPGHYSQIILNLLTNADRYAYPSGKGGKVEIVLSNERGAGMEARYLVVIRDFGQGIPEENLSRIFDPFFTTGRSAGGTGLGLSIVKTLVTDSLGGEIRVESSPGQGTQIEMNIPLVVRESLVTE